MSNWCRDLIGRIFKAIADWARLALALIRVYQREVAPQIRSRRCRYRPTCSHYAVEAVERYGVMTGVGLALRRVSRCNAAHAGGDDPVPLRY
jgi:uncharacterized protein